MLFAFGAVIGSACSSETLDLTAHEPCLAVFMPNVFSIGVVERGRTISRTIAIENAGTSRCELVSIFAREPEAELTVFPSALPVSLAPRERAFFGIELRLPESGNFENAVVAVMASGETFVLPLRAGSGDTELVLIPDHLDFESQLGCAPRTRTVTVFNTGPVFAAAPVTLQGPHADAFVALAPTTLLLEPGASAALDVVFLPRFEGVHDATLVAGDETAQLRAVGVRGERIVEEHRVPELPKTDVLFAIDNSITMAPFHADLEANLRAWFEVAAALELDVHFAATTTDMASGSAQGRLLPIDGALVLTGTSSDDVLRAIIPGVDGSTQTSGLEAVARAVSEPLRSGHNAGFFREDAWLAVVIISAAEDRSPGTVDSYLARINPMGSPRISISGAVGDRGGCEGPNGSAIEATRYLEAIAASGGIASSICWRDWSRSLENIGTTFSKPTVFYLDYPARPETIEIDIDGVSIPATQPNGTRLWSYDAATSAVRITAFAAPSPGSVVTIRYERACE